MVIVESGDEALAEHGSDGSGRELRVRKQFCKVLGGHLQHRPAVQIDLLEKSNDVLPVFLGS